MNNTVARLVFSLLSLWGSLCAMDVNPQDLITVVCADGQSSLAGSDLNDLKKMSGLSDILNSQDGKVFLPALSKECFVVLTKNLGVITRGGKPLDELLVSYYENNNAKEFCALLTAADYLNIEAVNEASNSFLMLKIPEIFSGHLYHYYPPDRWTSEFRRSYKKDHHDRDINLLEELIRLPFNVCEFANLRCKRTFLFELLESGYPSLVNRLIQKGVQWEMDLEGPTCDTTIAGYYRKKRYSLEEVLSHIQPIVAKDLEALRAVYQNYLVASNYKAFCELVKCSHALGIEVITTTAKEFYKTLIDQDESVFFVSIVEYQTKERSRTYALLGNDGGLFLCYAASLKDKSLFVGSLISAGVDINSADEKGVTPLIEAAKNGHRYTVEVLLRLKASVDLSDKNGRTPLMEAARNGHTHIVLLLQNSGVSVGLKDLSGMTALEHAAMNSHEGAVKALRATEDHDTVKSYMESVRTKVHERNKKPQTPATAPSPATAPLQMPKSSRWSTRRSLLLLGLGCGLSYFFYKRYTRQGLSGEENKHTDEDFSAGVCYRSNSAGWFHNNE